MKNVAQEPRQLRDALASLPEPLDLHDLVVQPDRHHGQDGSTGHETFPVSAPISPSPVR